MIKALNLANGLHGGSVVLVCSDAVDACDSHNYFHLHGRARGNDVAVEAGVGTSHASKLTLRTP
ncbi:UNVERIFIED_CONTAM: hypothetical protein NY603_26425, partial [Bacteroidetes bacterium 56_B9]